MCGATIRGKRSCTISYTASPGAPRPRSHRCGGIGATGFPQSVVARTGLTETLAALQAQGLRLGVVTNGEVAFQAPKITQLAIERYLSTVVISEAVQVQKPDPRIFTHALAAVGCSAQHTWFVGDDPRNDILGAAGIGAPSDLVAGGAALATRASGAHLADCRTRRNRDYGAMCQQRNLTRGRRRRQTACSLGARSSCSLPCLTPGVRQLQVADRKSVQTPRDAVIAHGERSSS